MIAGADGMLGHAGGAVSGVMHGMQSRHRCVGCTRDSFNL